MLIVCLDENKWIIDLISCWWINVPEHLDLCSHRYLPHGGNHTLLVLVTLSSLNGLHFTRTPNYISYLQELMLMDIGETHICTGGRQGSENFQN